MGDIFTAIADPARRDILNILFDAYGEPDVTAGQLAGELQLPAATVARHLKVLSDAGLVVTAGTGQARTCRLDPTPLEAVEDWLTPYLGGSFVVAAFDEDGGSAVFAAWSGADVGETIGRAIADGSHQARAVIHDASEKVTRVLPEKVTRRWKNS